VTTPADLRSPQTLTLVGTVHNLRKAVTKAGELWISSGVVVIDEPRQVDDLKVFPKTYAKFGHLFAEGHQLRLTGEWDHRFEQPPFLVAGVELLATSLSTLDPADVAPLPSADRDRMLAEAKEVAGRLWGPDGLPRPEFVDSTPISLDGRAAGVHSLLGRRDKGFGIPLLEPVSATWMSTTVPQVGVFLHEHRVVVQRIGDEGSHLDLSLHDPALFIRLAEILDRLDV
jgi:hypothetical protein